MILDVNVIIDYIGSHYDCDVQFTHYIHESDPYGSIVVSFYNSNIRLGYFKIPYEDVLESNSSKRIPKVIGLINTYIKGNIPELMI